MDPEEKNETQLLMTNPQTANSRKVGWQSMVGQCTLLYAKPLRHHCLQTGSLQLQPSIQNNTWYGWHTRRSYMICSADLIFGAIPGLHECPKWQNWSGNLRPHRHKANLACRLQPCFQKLLEVASARCQVFVCTSWTAVQTSRNAYSKSCFSNSVFALVDVFSSYRCRHICFDMCMSATLHQCQGLGQTVGSLLPTAVFWQCVLHLHGKLVARCLPIEVRRCQPFGKQHGKHVLFDNFSRNLRATACVDQADNLPAMPMGKTPTNVEACE